MKRLFLPGIPFALSMGLSLSTAGSHLYWQDSGFFLVAVKELGVLYPPGFVLYVLLCKAWTLVFGFLDFTYAVHLFSATCAAGAAGTIAVAARDLLRTKGPIFHTAEEEGPLAEWVGASIGCLAASGYTFWAAAILAKVYAFYYLILCLLIWRMIRADESGRPRDFTGVAVLIGLAWQAHPSATNAGLALILFVAFHRRGVGWKGVGWRVLLAYACAMGPVYLLPILASNGSALRFDHPKSFGDCVSYALGSRFLSSPGAFGLENTRVASVFRYGWEEFLGIGVLALTSGVWRLWQENKRLLLGTAVWVLPVLFLTVFFKLEGQHDFWMVAAWIPLWLVAAVGLSVVGKGREMAVVLALIGVVWAVVANRRDLDQRDYTLAETFGRYFLEAPGRVGAVFLSSDDAQSTAVYLRCVKGVRPEIFLAGTSIQSGVPPYRLPGARFLAEASPEFLPERAGFPPRGALYLNTTLSERAPAAPEDWREPALAQDVMAARRRARGQFVERRAGGLAVRPEPYEDRLLRLILLIRLNHAGVLAKEGRLSEAESVYESMLKLDPRLREDGAVLMSLAVVEVGLKEFARAEGLFKSALAGDLDPKKRAEACYFLAALSGERPEGAEWKSKALTDPNLAPELRARLEGR